MGTKIAARWDESGGPCSLSAKLKFPQYSSLLINHVYSCSTSAMSPNRSQLGWELM